jgi:hypothetical protein
MPSALISKDRDQSMHQEDLKRSRKNWYAAFFAAEIERWARREHQLRSQF